MRLLVMSADGTDREIVAEDLGTADDTGSRNAVEDRESQDGWNIVESREKGVSERRLTCQSEEELCSQVKGLDWQQYDVAVLRLSRRIRTGIAVAALRSMIPVPLLVIGGEDTYYEEIQCLQHGADDYQRRETPEPIVLLRLWRLMEIGQSEAQGRGILARRGFFELPEVCRIRYGQRDLKLTRREYEVLHWLLQDVSDIIPKRRILLAVWGQAEREESRALDTVMKQLRRKLSVTPWGIETCYGRGYRLIWKA